MAAAPVAAGARSPRDREVGGRSLQPPQQQQQAGEAGDRLSIAAGDQLEDDIADPLDPEPVHEEVDVLIHRQLALHPYTLKFVGDDFETAFLREQYLSTSFTVPYFLCAVNALVVLFAFVRSLSLAGVDEPVSVIISFGLLFVATAVTITDAYLLMRAEERTTAVIERHEILSVLPRLLAAIVVIIVSARLRVASMCAQIGVFMVTGGTGASAEERRLFCMQAVPVQVVIHMAAIVVPGRPRFLVAAPVLVAEGLAFVLTFATPQVPSEGTEAAIAVSLLVFFFSVAGVVIIFMREKTARDMYASSLRRAIKDADNTFRSAERTARLAPLVPPVVVSRIDRGVTVDVSRSATLLAVRVADFPAWFSAMVHKTAAHATTTITTLVCRIVESNGFQLLRSGGDAFLFSANLLSPAENSVETACKAALQLQAKATSLRIEKPPTLAISIATGFAVGAVFGERYLRHEVFGEAVREAMALVVVCPAKSTFVTEAVRIKCATSYVFTDASAPLPNGTIPNTPSPFPRLLEAMKDDAGAPIGSESVSQNPLGSAGNKQSPNGPNGSPGTASGENGPMSPISVPLMEIALGNDPDCPFSPKQAPHAALVPRPSSGGADGAEGAANAGGILGPEDTSLTGGVSSPRRPRRIGGSGGGAAGSPDAGTNGAVTAEEGGAPANVASIEIVVAQTEAEELAEAQQLRFFGLELTADKREQAKQGGAKTALVWLQKWRLVQFADPDIETANVIRVRNDAEFDEHRVVSWLVLGFYGVCVVAFAITAREGHEHFAPSVLLLVAVLAAATHVALCFARGVVRRSGHAVPVLLCLASMFLFTATVFARRNTIGADPLFAVVMLSMFYAAVLRYTQHTLEMKAAFFLVGVAVPFSVTSAANNNLFTLHSLLTLIAAVILVMPGVLLPTELLDRQRFGEQVVADFNRDLQDAELAVIDAVCDSFPQHVRAFTTSRRTQGVPLSVSQLPDSVVACLRFEGLNAVPGNRPLRTLAPTIVSVRAACNAVSKLDEAMRIYSQYLGIANVNGDMVMFGGPLIPKERKGDDSHVRRACVECLSVLCQLFEDELLFTAALVVESCFAVVPDCAHPQFDLVGRAVNLARQVTLAAAAGSIVCNEFFSSWAKNASVATNSPAAPALLGGASLSALPTTPAPPPSAIENRHRFYENIRIEAPTSWRIRSMGQLRLQAVKFSREPRPDGGTFSVAGGAAPISAGIVGHASGSTRGAERSALVPMSITVANGSIGPTAQWVTSAHQSSFAPATVAPPPMSSLFAIT